MPRTKTTVFGKGLFALRAANGHVYEADEKSACWDQVCNPNTIQGSEATPGGKRNGSLCRDPQLRELAPAMPGLTSKLRVRQPRWNPHGGVLAACSGPATKAAAPPARTSLRVISMRLAYTKAQPPRRPYPPKRMMRPAGRSGLNARKARAHAQRMKAHFNAPEAGGSLPLSKGFACETGGQRSGFMVWRLAQKARKARSGARRAGRPEAIHHPRQSASSACTS